MKILVVGAGGREHAIIRKLKQSRDSGEIYCIPGNGGISKDAICPHPELKATDIDAIVDFAVNNKIEFAVVAPDDPLVLGMVDALEAKGIAAFGPSKKAAVIEGSKIFSKSLMQKYGIPTADYVAFESESDALDYLWKGAKYPLVVKADGLALGKGVVIAENYGDAKRAVLDMMSDKIFGESGSKIVIEEFLTGPEVTVLAFTDGVTVAPMVSSMDHKRALDGNLGLNTGGMGTIAPNPHYTPYISDVCMRDIFEPTIYAMAKEGRPFKGCIYFGLMLTPAGPKVIEYNCRFGDPEAQVVLELLGSDLLEIMQAVRDERLCDINIKWKNIHAVCVVMASGGYPGKYETGKLIYGLDKNGGLANGNISVYHAGTRAESGLFVTVGGRVLGVTATNSTLEKAIRDAYFAVERINFEDAHYRKDIGKY